MAVVAAFAGVHGGDELEAAGISGASGGSADRDAAVLEGLAQHFEALAGELGQFVEEEDAAVGQTALAGAELRPAARQRSRTGRVVGAAERPCRYEAPACGHLPGDGINFRRLHGFFPGQGRQDAGQAAGQHGFAGAGRTDEQDVVSARRRDDHRPAGQRLAADVSEIGNVAPRIGRVEGNRSRGRNGLDAPQCVHDLTGRCCRVDLHFASAGLSGFGSVLGGDIERPHTAGGSFQRHGQDAGHRAETAVQRQLPQKGRVLRRRLQLPGSGQHRQQQGQVIHRAGLADVGGSEVDGDAAVRPLEAQIFQGCVDAVAALPDGGVRQADDGEGGHPARDVGLDFHGEAVEALEAEALEDCVHGRSFLPDGAAETIHKRG